MGAAIPRLNGIPGFMKNEKPSTSRGSFALFALSSLIELVKSVIKGVFASILTLICLGCNPKWNQKALEEIKGIFTFAFLFPICLIGIAAPRIVDRMTS